MNAFSSDKASFSLETLILHQVDKNKTKSLTSTPELQCETITKTNKTLALIYYLWVNTLLAQG